MVEHDLTTFLMILLSLLAVAFWAANSVALEYERTLDEIKKYCKRELREDKQAYISASYILDIINKEEE